jgi:acyl carrier protein
MMTQTTTRERIHEFIVGNFLFDSGDLRDDASLMGEGIVDSTGVLELVMFVEESFGIIVDDDEVLPDNFDSVVVLAAYVERKIAASSRTLAS